MSWKAKWRKYPKFKTEGQRDGKKGAKDMKIRCFIPGRGQYVTSKSSRKNKQNN